MDEEIQEVGRWDGPRENARNKRSPTWVYQIVPGQDMERTRPDGGTSRKERLRPEIPRVEDTRDVVLKSRGGKVQTLTDDESESAASNLLSFFELLIQADKQQRKRNENNGNPDCANKG